MADIIAKESQLSSSITTNIAAKKSRVSALGKTLRTGTSYSDAQLVRKKDIISSTSTVYRNVAVGTATNSVGDIPASGGSRRAQATVTYEYATRTTYVDGSYTDSSYTSASSTIYGSYITGSSLGTTVKSRTSLGTSTPSGTVAGATRTATGIAIYQAANAITKRELVADPQYSDATASNTEAELAMGTISGKLTYTSGSTSTVTPTNISKTFTATSTNTYFTGISSTNGNWTTASFGKKVFYDGFYKPVIRNGETAYRLESPAVNITISATVSGATVQATYTRYAYKEPNVITNLILVDEDYGGYYFNWPSTMTRSTQYCVHHRYITAVFASGQYSQYPAYYEGDTDHNSIWLMVDSSNNFYVRPDYDAYYGTSYNFIARFRVYNASTWSSYTGNSSCTISQTGCTTSPDTAQSNAKIKEDARLLRNNSLTISQYGALASSTRNKISSYTISVPASNTLYSPGGMTKTIQIT